MAMPRFQPVLATLTARLLWVAGRCAVVGLTPWLVVLPSAGSAQSQQVSQKALTYTITNPGAGSPARYGLLFPMDAASLRMSNEPWVLVFDAELDVDVYQRRLRFCYRTDRDGRLPAHSRCVDPILAEFTVTTGPGKDRIAITPKGPIDSNRQLGVWVDLINPLTPGFYGIDLMLRPTGAQQANAQPVGGWLIRIEHPIMESPGSGD